MSTHSASPPSSTLLSSSSCGTGSLAAGNKDVVRFIPGSSKVSNLPGVLMFLLSFRFFQQLLALQ